MASMGRKRKDNPLGLPPRVYFKHGQFHHVGRDGKWHALGKDVGLAIAEGKRRNEQASSADYGLVSYWWGEWLKSLADRAGKPRAARGIAERTVSDYTIAGKYLVAYFGAMLPTAVLPAHVGAYLDEAARADRAVRGNREKAAFSAFFTWLIRQPDSGVRVNPCFGVQRNPESARTRYIEDAEYRAVYEKAPRMVRALMTLVYRTLQRPEDIITWTPAANIRKVDGRRVIDNTQAKTGAKVLIAIEGELATCIDELLGVDKVKLAGTSTLIHRLNGHPYTYDGLSAMFKRARDEAGVKDFGPYDCKSKGATDMYLSGVPIEQIQALCGHDTARTTEIYIRRHLRTVVTANHVGLASGGQASS